MALDNKTYDRLKWIVQILAPAVATLYVALAAIWGLPHVEAVVGTITALTTFAGTVLHISSAAHAASGDGELHVKENDDGSTVYAVLGDKPEDLEGMVTLKVVKQG